MGMMMRCLATPSGAAAASILALLALSVAAAAPSAVPSVDGVLPVPRLDCNGVSGECSLDAGGVGGSAEWLMDSLSTGRLLLQSGSYITPGALRANQPAYNNAGSGNPYARGCQAIYGCRQY